MKKFCFIFLILILLIFSSCNSTPRDQIVSSEGISYIVVRDDDGNIVINDNDKLQVYVVNENGKKQKNDNNQYITEYIDFNGQVVIDKTVETSELRFALPAGFKDDENNPGYFYNESIKGEIFIAYYGTDCSAAISSAEKSCESLLESYGSDVFEYKKYSIEVEDIVCSAFKQRCTSSEFYKNAYVYYLPYDTGFYLINCNISTDNEKKVNFDKFIESFEIK